MVAEGMGAEENLDLYRENKIKAQFRICSLDMLSSAIVQSVPSQVLGGPHCRRSHVSKIFFAIYDQVTCRPRLLPKTELIADN